MRIHIQNDPEDPLFAVTETQWRDAAARAPDVGKGHQVSIGESREDFARAMREAEVLIIASPVVRSLFPADAPRLKLISCLSAGLEKLAPFDMLPPGVPLLNNSGAHGAKAGEYVLMALLMIANRMPEIAADQRAHRWHKRFGAVMRGRRVTVVGLGDLGGAGAAQAARLGMEVTGVRTRAEPHPDCVRVVAVNDLDSVLPDSEFLVLATPLTPATRNLMDRRRLGLLPHGAGLVNIGRGALVDQDALCDLLEEGRIGGAVLDVFVPEPVPSGHRLWTTRNLVMTPHVSCDDPAIYNEVSLDVFFDNLRAFQAGGPMPNLFDTARGY